VHAVCSFSDTSAYRGVSESNEIAYHGLGYSAGAVLAINAHLAVTGFWRGDTRLTSEVGSITAAVSDLPQMVGGAIRWAPAPDVSFAGSVLRRSWAVAADRTPTTRPLVGRPRCACRGPRFGRGRPAVGPGGRAPSEFAVAADPGWPFPRSRIIDFAFERLRRRSGLTETGWMARRPTLRP
jgi:hypothetical protein